MKNYNLRQLITHDMDAAKHQLTKDEINGWLCAIPKITDSLICQLHFAAKAPVGNNVTKRRISAIQADCCFMLNALNKLDEPAKDLQPLREAASKCLEDVLDQIDVNFVRYRNVEILLPGDRLIKHLKSVREKTIQITSLFEKWQVKAELQTIVLTPMNVIAGLKRSTYARTMYMLELQDAIIELLDGETSDTDRELIELLYRMNFNSAEFAGFYHKWIMLGVDRMYQGRFKLDRLEVLQKRFKATYPGKTKLQLDLKRYTLNHYLRELVAQEIATMPVEKPQVDRSMDFTRAMVNPVLQNTARMQKILSLQSVDVLAYLFRLMVDAQVMETGVKTEFSALVASMFTTPNTGAAGISPISFYNKFRQPVQSTAVVTKVLLNKMIKLIDQKF